MQRPRSTSSYLDRPIERETHTLTRTIAMPCGGYKNTRVVTKDITLARVPRRPADLDPDSQT